MKVYKLNHKHRSYPEKLKDLQPPAKQISMLGGDLDGLFDMPSLGIVGSRKATGYGRAVTEELASVLARAGTCIVSGLAYGVDSIAHAAALKAKGRTIAVLPGGLKAIYPAGHRQLAKEIALNGGALISEYADDFRPRKESFIQRNRIIAALSDILLVTEAAERSGSLHTANFALEMGRTVLAVPGNITSPASAGTNNLIKSGAIAVTRPDDILQALNITPQSLRQTDIYADNEEEAAVLEIIRSGVTSADELLRRSGLEVQSFQRTLSMLEIKGAISPLGNNHWSLK